MVQTETFLKGMVMRLEKGGIRVELAVDPAKEKLCYQLRHEVYCVERRWEPVQSDGLERHVWDVEGLAVSAIAFLNEQPLATMQYVRPRVSEYAFPMFACLSQQNVLLDLPQGINPCEFMRYACPKRLSRQLGADPMLRGAVRLALLHVLVEDAASNGFDYGLMLVEPGLQRLLQVIKLKVSDLAPGTTIEHKGQRIACGTHLQEFRSCESSESIL